MARTSFSEFGAAGVDIELDPAIAGKVGDPPPARWQGSRIFVKTQVRQRWAAGQFQRYNDSRQAAVG